MGWLAGLQIGGGSNRPCVSHPLTAQRVSRSTATHGDAAAQVGARPMTECRTSGIGQQDVRVESDVVGRRGG